MDELRVVVPMPSRKLHPNARVHHMTKAAATKKARGVAFINARLALSRGRTTPHWPAAEVWSTWYFRENRRRDPDGLMASMKAVLDGLTDAGVWTDDEHVRLHPPTLVVEPGCEPRVELVIRPLPSPAASPEPEPARPSRSAGSR